MDPVTTAIIVNAISVGAGTATGVVVSDAVRGIYNNIKAHFRKSKSYDLIPVDTLDSLALSEDGKEKLEQVLKMVDANRDQELIALSAELIKQAEQENIALPAGIDINIVEAVIKKNVSIKGNQSDGGLKVDAQKAQIGGDFAVENNEAGDSKNA